MEGRLLTTLVGLGAIVLGGVIGLAFGSLQNAALLQNQKKQRGDNSKKVWAFLPGSAGRIAFLLVGLALVQIACPMFFEKEGMQWIVSLGVILGYGWTLLDQVRMKSSHQV
jgi:hypothetical protein